MNDLDSNKDQQTLSKLLRRWEVKTPLPPGFRRLVWQRLARSQNQNGFSALDWLVNGIQTALLRPSVALIYVMILLVMGSAFGWSKAQRGKGQLDQALGLQYVQSIDPYQRFR